MALLRLLIPFKLIELERKVNYDVAFCDLNPQQLSSRVNGHVRRSFYEIE